MKFCELSAFYASVRHGSAALACLCIALACLTCQHAAAVEVPNLYQASVAVKSRDDERERQQAFSSAMREVLVKVTGRQEVLDNTQIRRAVASPQSYVEAWAYRSSQEAPAAAGVKQPGAGEVIQLEVTFFQPEILRLLGDNNIAMWPSNRPLTLVWVVQQDELGQREIVGSASDNDVSRQIRTLGRMRGLPLLLPLMDFEDRQDLTVEDLWNLNLDAIRDASKRYQVDSILAVRLFRSLSGEQLGRSAYLFRQRVISEEDYANSLAEFMQQPINLTARELSANYAVLLSGTNSTVVVKMTIDGIENPKNYASLLNYIDKLADVNSYSIIGVNQETINLELRTGGQLRQLVETIALENTLQPVGEPTRVDDEVFMHYRWVNR